MHWGKADVARLERPERQALLPAGKMLDLLPPLEGKILADVGAGTGYVAFSAAERVGAAGKVYAVDISERMVTFMERRKGERGVANLEPLMSTPDRIPLPDASVDVALSVSCFHDYEDERTVAETARTLKPSGRFLVVDWNPDAPEGVPGPARGHRLPRGRVAKDCAKHGFSLEKGGDLNRHVYWLLFRKE